MHRKSGLKVALTFLILKRIFTFQFLRLFHIRQQDVDARSWICPGHSAKFSSSVWGSKEKQKLPLSSTSAISRRVQNRGQSKISPSVVLQ